MRQRQAIEHLCADCEFVGQHLFKHLRLDRLVLKRPGVLDALDDDRVLVGGCALMGNEASTMTGRHCIEPTTASEATFTRFPMLLKLLSATGRISGRSAVSVEASSQAQRRGCMTVAEDGRNRLV